MRPFENILKKEGFIIGEKFRQESERESNLSEKKGRERE